MNALEGSFHLRSEVATMLRVSDGALRNWRRQYPDELGPSFATQFQGARVYLYTDEDVARLRAHVERLAAPRPDGGRPLKRGRRQLWTEAERTVRDRLRVKARHLIVRAAVLEVAGDLETAASKRAESAAISARLNDQYDQRMAAVRERLPQAPREASI